MKRIFLVIAVLLIGLSSTAYSIYSSAAAKSHEDYIEIYFCPRDNCSDHVVEILDNAESSIYFMTYTLTDKDIAFALVKKDRQGIDVRGVTERNMRNVLGSKYSFLMENKINLKLDNNRHIMHHKVFIVDKKTVITGSFNPTNNGNLRNNENLVIIHDKGIAKSYLQEFKFLWEMKYQNREW